MRKKGIIDPNSWNCHCCGALNNKDIRNCRVCGRDESYALDGYPLPLHGIGAKLFRPSQVTNIMGEGGLYERDSAEWTALHSASVNGNTPTVQELINLGGVVDAATDKGQTPLHVATYAGSLETVTALIRAGAYVNAVTSFERMTPLHIACQRNWKDVAKYLITKGADVHALNIIERTPLHFAAAVGRTDLGVVLLQAGAKSDAMDIHGWTPRQVAELHDNRSFQELMVQANMPEKQPVIKELPPAAWHGELWASMIEINKEKRAEAEKDRRRVERTAEEVKIAIRRERKRELDNWTTASYLSSIKEAETFSDSISMLSTTSSSAMDMLHSTAPDSGAGVVHAVRKGALNATAAAVPRRSKLAESAVRQLGVRR